MGGTLARVAVLLEKGLSRIFLVCGKFRPWFFTINRGLARDASKKSQRVPKMGQPSLNQREFSNVAFPLLLQVPVKHGDGGL